MAGFDYSHYIFRNGVYLPDASEMGDEYLRFAFDKDVPLLLLEDEEVPLTAQYDETGEEYFLERSDGYLFQAKCHSDARLLDMELVTPDGTIWQGRGGYHFGRRFEDECGTAEAFYERVKSRHFQWTQVREDER